MLLTYITPDGAEGEIPAKYEVCDRCRGTGTHVNPNIDGNGLTMEEVDLDFLEDYMSGAYDVRCSECHGDRVVLVADTDQASAAVVAEYEEYLARQWDYDQEREMERRMGC